MDMGRCADGGWRWFEAEQSSSEQWDAGLYVGMRCDAMRESCKSESTVMAVQRKAKQRKEEERKHVVEMVAGYTLVQSIAAVFMATGCCSTLLHGCLFWLHGS